MFSEVCVRRTTPVPYSAARSSGALILQQHQGWFLWLFGRSGGGRTIARRSLERERHRMYVFVFRCLSFVLGCLLGCVFPLYFLKGCSGPYYDRFCRSGAREKGHLESPPPLPWPFGPHVAGYQIKDNKQTDHRGSHNFIRPQSICTIF